MGGDLLIYASKVAVKECLGWYFLTSFDDTTDLDWLLAFVFVILCSVIPRRLCNAWSSRPQP